MTTRLAVALLAAASAASLAACSGAPTKSAQVPAARVQSPVQPAVTSPRRVSPYAPAQEDPAKRGNYTRGGLYAPEIRDSAPDGLPDVDLIPEPEVKTEPRSLYGNRSPYQVLGKSYAVLDDPSTYDEVGLASYYGNKFHGRRTSNLEVYDMYAFTAAHKTLPLPSFARVTNLANGRSVVVRVNDRGPFHDGRIIDLSYAAAVKLGVDRMGTARVEVKGLGPGEPVDALATQPAASHDVVSNAVVPAAASSTALAIRTPTSAPRIDATPITSAGFTCTLPLARCRITPVAAVGTMAKSEVAAASTWPSPSATRVGTNRIPPPTPNMPESTPAARPSDTAATIVQVLIRRAARPRRPRAGPRTPA